MSRTRDKTIKIYEMVDEGLLTWEAVAEAALRWMSEAEVAEMAEANEWLQDDEDEEEQA